LKLCIIYYYLFCYADLFVDWRCLSKIEIRALLLRAKLNNCAVIKSYDLRNAQIEALFAFVSCTWMRLSIAQIIIKQRKMFEYLFVLKLTFAFPLLYFHHTGHKKMGKTWISTIKIKTLFFYYLKFLNEFIFFIWSEIIIDKRFLGFLNFDESVQFDIIRFFIQLMGYLKFWLFQR